MTDGMGGINFLRELTYQYLRLAHPKLRETQGDQLSADTSLNREDSFLKNYKKKSKSVYQSKRAFLIKGEKLAYDGFGVIHGYLPIHNWCEGMMSCCNLSASTSIWWQLLSGRHIRKIIAILQRTDQFVWRFRSICVRILIPLRPDLCHGVCRICTAKKRIYLCGDPYHYKRQSACTDQQGASGKDLFLQCIQ